MSEETTESNLLSELTKSVKAKLYDRLEDPLLSNFTIFWILYSWRPLLILILDTSDISLRITKVQFEYGFLTITCKGLLNWIIPLIFSLLYIYIYPKLKLRISDYYYKQMVILKNAKKKHFEELLLTMEEMATILKPEKAKSSLIEENAKSIKSDLAVISNFLLDQFKLNYQLTDNAIGLVATRCESKHFVGAWVNLRDGFCSFSSPNQGLWANGIIIYKIGEFHCIVQTAGAVNLKKFGITFPGIEPNEMRDYCLSDIKDGFMLEKSQVKFKFKQILGRFVLASEEFQMKIMSPSSDSA